MEPDSASDYLIVGGGTAGCVLAKRLSEDGKVTVRLLEAGGKPKSPFVKIPAAFTKLFKSDHDWDFESAPQTDTKRVVYIPRGKMLGGSSNMNAQVHQWGHPDDFDGWVKAGAAGWSWQDVQPVFRRQETLRNASDDRRGRTGEMRVEVNAHCHPLSHAFLEAAHNAGLPRTPGYNGERFEGAWVPEIAHSKGRRFSAYDAFLLPAMKRPNLEVLTNAHVKRIIFDKKRATGVVYRGPGGERSVMARHGVILAAGAIGSPHILICSGAGPGSQVQKLGLDVIADIPGVGLNLHDHPLACINFSVRRKDTFKSAESPVNFLQYMLFGKGPLASNVVEAIAFARSSGNGGDPADIELIFLPVEWRAQGLENAKYHAFVIAGGVLNPVSRGALAVISPDTAISPSIDFNLLGDPGGQDARTLLAALRLARRIAATSPLADEVVEELTPGVSVTSDEALLNITKMNWLQTIYHPAGTCRMGTDDNAVVSPALEVKGVERLWVADASVMPALVRGHPNAAVAMIAHRAADFIRGQSSPTTG